MKSIKFFAIVMAAVMSFAACQKNEPTPSKPDSKLTLKVSASVYNFTKATDTAFEENDEIGLYMFKGEETYAENHKYTYAAGALTTAEDIAWYEETEVVANITAYYPYSENAYNGEFTVNADQSSVELYKASDLLLASAQSAPTKNTVVLPFKHALSKVVVTFDNQLNEEIANVYFTDLLGKVAVNVNDATVEATGSTGTIKALKTGENAWQLIVAPQTASPKLAVTTASGKQYTFVLEEAVTFSAGKVSTATNVVLSTETISTSFTPEIEDWVADNELNFSQNDENVELPEEEVVVPNVPAEPENKNVVYLEPDIWKTDDNPRFVVYSWDDKGHAWTDMTDLNGDLIYRAVLPEGHKKLIFCRMNTANLENRWNTDEENYGDQNSDLYKNRPMWNKTIDLTISEGNCYKISSWNGQDGNSTGTWKTIEAND